MYNSHPKNSKSSTPLWRSFWYRDLNTDNIVWYLMVIRNKAWRLIYQISSYFSAFLSLKCLNIYDHLTEVYFFTFAIQSFTHLTLRGPCTVIYSYNKSQWDALFLNFIFLHVSDRSTVHHQESQHCKHSNRYLSCYLCWLSASEVRMLHPDLASRQST